MGQRINKIIKAISFTIITLLTLVVCNFIVKPVWHYAIYNSLYGFYEEPSDTIETVFLGASHVYCGISSIKLYEDYGICAYDISSEKQPLAASYYWLEEVYKYHSQTLDTVVLDVSRLRGESSEQDYHKSIDLMNFSMTKIKAVKAYSENFEDFLQNMFPLLYYHERWKELSSSDFFKYSYEPNLYYRGFNYVDEQVISSVNDFYDIYTPLLVIDEDEEDSKLDDIQIQYFKKIVSFCKEQNLQLVLIKTPTNWTSADHNAVQDLADTYGLDFIDFNIDPYYSEVGFNLAIDSHDATTTATNIHLNYYGANKLTEYLGQYLIEECGNIDVRGDERYSFMEEELSDYNQFVTFRQSLLNATDPCDYIETALDDGDCMIFISVKDDAATSLTKEQRAYFKSIGLTELSQLTYGCSYLAVIDNGSVITEQYQEDPGKESENDDIISYTGTLHNGTAYTIVSGGFHMGNKSSIIIEGTEYSSNERGLNISVYDNKLQRYVMSANFDTWLASERSAPVSEQNYEALMEEGRTASSLTGEDRILNLYSRECENERIVKLARMRKNEKDGLIAYLKAFWDNEDIDIFIMTQGDVSDVLTDSLRVKLSELGLSELSQLSYSYSYVAAICNGDITEEMLRYSKVPLEITTDQYTVRSVRGEESNSASSVIINGTEYSAEEDGIYIVIYDNITEMVIDTITFEPNLDDVEEAEAVLG